MTNKTKSRTMNIFFRFVSFLIHLILFFFSFHPTVKCPTKQHAQIPDHNLSYFQQKIIILAITVIKIQRFSELDCLVFFSLKCVCVSVCVGGCMFMFVWGKEKEREREMIFIRNELLTSISQVLPGFLHFFSDKKKFFFFY